MHYALIIIFRDLLTFFFATSKDHLTQGNILKTALLNEKRSNFGKEMDGNISLYSNIFHLGRK